MYITKQAHCDGEAATAGVAAAARVVVVQSVVGMGTKEVSMVKVVACASPASRLECLPKRFPWRWRVLPTSSRDVRKTAVDSLKALA